MRGTVKSAAADGNEKTAVRAAVKMGADICYLCLGGKSASKFTVFQEFGKFHSKTTFQVIFFHFPLFWVEYTLPKHQPLFATFLNLT